MADRTLLKTLLIRISTQNGLLDTQILEKRPQTLYSPSMHFPSKGFNVFYSGISEKTKILYIILFPHFSTFFF